MTAPIYQPLKGIRVLSFELAFSLPAGTRALADLGAEVVRVARPDHNAFGNYISVIDGVFQSKTCIAIDLKTERGQQLAFDLALQADVVCNNYRPGVLEKYGLGAENLRASNSKLIWLQLSGYGTPGPWSEFPAYGPSTEAAGGLNRLLVNEGETPIRIGTGVFADQLSGRHAAMAIINALIRREEEGIGSTLDLAMSECVTHLMGPLITRASLDGVTPESLGNRDQNIAPQGVYPCDGDDEWIALSVGSDDEWRQLVTFVSDESLDANWDTVARRKKQDEIDASIAAWCSRQNKNVVAERLQQYGIAATPVRTVADSVEDPQFIARGSLQPVKHARPQLGADSHPHPTLPWRIVGRERRPLEDMHTAGEDNAEVLRRWLGLPSEETQTLEQEGVLYVEGPLALDEDLVIDDLSNPDFTSNQRPTT